MRPRAASADSDNVARPYHTGLTGPQDVVARGLAGALGLRDVRSLQRSIGNRATVALLTTSSPRGGTGLPVLQRASLDTHAKNNDPRPGEPFCFTAVLTWLLRSIDDRVTTESARERIIGAGHAGPVMAEILAKGTRLKRKGRFNKKFRVPTGSIVVFVRNGAPSHAAVATGPATITGYNQTHWFGGPANQYSHSDLTKIHWASKYTIKNSVGTEESVYAVDPDSAADVLT